MAFSAEAARTKLNTLSGSQQSVETLSLWFRHHRAHAAECVQVWSEALHAAKPKKKLCFMFLANDVLQHSRKRIPEYVTEYMNVLHSACGHCYRHCSEAQRPSLLRILNVWKERGVFSSSYVAQLRSTISSGDSAGGVDGSSPGRPPLVRRAGSSSSSSRGSAAQPKASELHAAFTELKKVCAGDAELVLQIKQAVPEDLLSSDDALLTVEDEAGGRQLEGTVDAASGLLAAYQGRLAAQVEDRTMLLRLLAGYLDFTRQAVRKGKSSLLDLDSKLANLQAIQRSLSDRIPHLPPGKRGPAATPAAATNSNKRPRREAPPPAQDPEAVPAWNRRPRADAPEPAAMAVPPATAGSPARRPSKHKRPWEIASS